MFLQADSIARYLEGPCLRIDELQRWRVRCWCWNPCLVDAERGLLVVFRRADVQIEYYDEERYNHSNVDELSEDTSSHYLVKDIILSINYL